MTTDKSNHPVYAVQVGGHGQTKDPSQTGMSKYRRIGHEDQNVPVEHLYFNPSLAPADQKSKDTYGGTLDPATPVLVQPSYPGSQNFTVIGHVRGFPKVGQTVPGNNDIVGRYINDLSENPWNQQLQVFAKPVLQSITRGGKKVKVAGSPQNFIPSMNNFKPHFGETYDEIGRKWEQLKNVPTAATPFSNIVNGNMLSQLPGSVLSLASTFKSLSSSQKQRIRSSVPSEDIYFMIEAALGSATDDPTDIDLGFNNRVDANTFSNNLVDLLCQCTTFSDIVAVKEQMYYDKTLHGLENLPEVEFKVNTGFGEVGLIIDAYGEVRQNVSNAVLESQQSFSDFLVGPENDFEDEAQFYGTIVDNVLTVNRMIYGTIQAGKQNILSGDNIPKKSYITEFVTGTGNTGTYLVSSPTQTTPNTIITISIKQEKTRSSNSSRNGGGGFPGMSAGSNFFGDASKLVGEVLPVLNPKGQSKLKSLMESISDSGGGPNTIIGQNDLVKGLVHVFDKGKFIK